jgi:hypothetical protein
VLELSLVEATIVACYAAASVLDAWAAPAGAYLVRVARDELWVIGARADRTTLMPLVEESVRSAASDVMVVDQTDGWTAWSIEGSGASQALGRLTVMPLERCAGAFHQGAVAGVPAKVIATAGGFQVLVPAPVGHHLRDRVIESCADLTPALGSARPFEGRAR